MQRLIDSKLYMRSDCSEVLRFAAFLAQRLSKIVQFYSSIGAFKKRKLEVHVSRSARIKHVLEQRKPLCERVKQVFNSVANIMSQLTAIKEGCRRADSLTAVRNKSALKAIESKCEKMIVELQAFTERSTPLRTRLERRTVNIGVIGLVGAGKSSLLQAITGLDSRVIPATHGTGSFTSTKSIIEHHENNEEAHVTFYTELELVANVLRPFLNRLNETQQHAEIQTLDEFLALDLPDNVSDEVRPTLVELKKYQEPARVEKYRPLLGGPSLKLKNLGEVGSFLTYWAPDLADAPLTAATEKKPLLQQSAWMATRHVTIRCRFKADDVGDVALIDMPGFGDKQAGNEERLVQALENDVDLALYVYKPAPHRDAWERSGAPQHFQIAKRALHGQLPFSRWSFVVLNHLRSTDISMDTYNICHELREKMYDEGVNAVSALICDVTEHRAVREQVLDPILNYLAENIASMDLDLAQEVQRAANDLQKSISSEVEDLRRLCNLAFEDTDEAELLVRKSSELWEQLKASLVTRLLHEVWPARNIDDTKYVELVKACVKSASEGSTDVATLKRVALNSSTKQAALHVMHDIRIEVVTALQPVYCSPFEAVVNLKKDITETLCNTGGFARLRRVSSATDKLAEISNVLRRLRGCPNLVVAIDLVREFDTSSSVLLPEIRKNLAKLDPEFVTPEELKPVLDVPGEPLADSKIEQTAKALNAIRKEVVEAIGKALTEKQKLPSQTAAYLLFEFVDRAVRDNSAVAEWRKAHNQLREELWPQDFAGLAEAKLAEKSIETALEALEFECEPIRFRFAHL